MNQSWGNTPKIPPRVTAEQIQAHNEHWQEVYDFAAKQMELSQRELERYRVIGDELLILAAQDQAGDFDE